MSTNNADGGVFEAPPTSTTEHATPQLPRSPMDSQERNADAPAATLQPDGILTVHTAASADGADVVYTPVPPTEPYVQRGRLPDGPYASHSPVGSSSLQQPIKDEQQQSHCGPCPVEEKGNEEAQSTAATMGDGSAFNSPTVAEDEEGDQTPTFLEAVKVTAHVDDGYMTEGVATNVATVETTAEEAPPVVSPASDPANDVTVDVHRNGGESRVSSPLAFPGESNASAAATSVDVGAGQLTNEPTAQYDNAALAEAFPVRVSPEMTTARTPIPPAAAGSVDAHAWVVDFGTGRPKPKRKMTKREKDAIKESHLRSHGSPATMLRATGKRPNVAAGGGLDADSEGNAVTMTHDDTTAGTALLVVHLDGLADRAAQIPTDLTTTRADLERRFVLRLPRLLCVNKQYPRGCGIASLTSVYNYLYSWLGESEVGAQSPPHSQEEIMSILGFEPPFGEIAWGPFTGNTTLIRWFHALNRYFGHRGKAYIFYKAHGHGKTTHIYPDSAAALVAVKAALRDPHCALIYHCHNHYMVPIGYQDIPHAQTDFLKPYVPESSCDTTIFIGEVSRGRHEAIYARKWAQVVKDIECKWPFYLNIRHPEQGVQRREPKKKKAAESVDAADKLTHLPPHQSQVDAAALMPSTSVPSSPQDIEMDAPAPQQQSADMADVMGVEVSVTVENTAVEGEERAGMGPAETLEETQTQDAAKPSSIPGVHVVEAAASLPLVSSLPLPSLEKFNAGAENVADAVRYNTHVEEVGEAVMTGPAIGNLAATPKSAGADAPDPRAAADTTAENVDPTEPADFLASPIPNAEVRDARAAPDAASQPPPDVDAEANMSASKTEAPLSLSVVAQASSFPLKANVPSRSNISGVSSSRIAELSSASAAPSEATKPKKERGNLHCFIIFRNDVEEENLDRYEDAPAREQAAVVRTAASSSASSDDSSSSSDDDGG